MSTSKIQTHIYCSIISIIIDSNLFKMMHRCDQVLMHHITPADWHFIITVFMTKFRFDLILSINTPDFGSITDKTCVFDHYNFEYSSCIQTVMLYANFIPANIQTSIFFIICIWYIDLRCIQSTKHSFFQSFVHDKME